MEPQYRIGQEYVQLEATRPVRVQPLIVLPDVPPHNHDFTEICLVESGIGTHRDSTGAQTLQAGTVIIVPPGPAHAFEDTQNLRVINIYYLAEWFLWDLNLLWRNEGLVPLFFASLLFRKPESRHLSLFTLDDVEHEVCLRELADIEAENARPEPSLFWVRGAFSKLLVTLARAWIRQTPHLNGYDFRAETWAALFAIDEAIKEGTTFRVDAFARQQGLSPDFFSRLFHNSTGLAPSEYFQSRRVQHASHLLLRSDLSISEISSRLGYADGAHLTRFFGKFQGCSPREFRKLYGTQVNSKFLSKE